MFKIAKFMKKLLLKMWLEDSHPSEGWKLKQNAPLFIRKIFEEFVDTTAKEPNSNFRIY